MFKFWFNNHYLKQRNEKTYTFWLFNFFSLLRNSKMFVYINVLKRIYNYEFIVRFLKFSISEFQKSALLKLLKSDFHIFIYQSLGVLFSFAFNSLRFQWNSPFRCFFMLIICDVKREFICKIAKNLNSY